MGILSGLSKKKKTEPVVLSVELLILETLKQNLNKQAPGSLNFETEVIKSENFQTDFIQNPVGFVLRFFTDSVKAPILIFVPNNFISKYISRKNEKDKELLNIFGFIPKYILANIDPDIELLNYIGMNLKNKDEFLWDVSAYKVIKIKTGSLSCFLFIEEKTFLMFNKNCQEYGIAPANIKGTILENISSNTFINRMNLNRNQADFLFGRFILPRSCSLGEHFAVSLFDSIRFKPEFERKTDGVNFVLNLSIDENIYYVNYFIPSQTDSRANLSKMIQSLVKAVLPLWKKYFEIEKIGGSVSFPKTTQVEFLITGGIKYKNSLIPIELGLSKGIVNLLASRIAELNVELSEGLTGVTLINQSLIHSFLEENLFLPLNLSEFLNLIDELDLRRIIQNFFSGTGWNGNIIQQLFSYSKKDIKKKKIYYFQDPLFNRERFFTFLPKSQKDEWKQTRSASVSYNEMISSGRNALRDIYHSFRNDHLELSYKAVTLLNNEFKVQGDKKIREELDKIIDKEPFLNLLEDTFPRDVQNLLAKLTAKVLANAVVLYSGSMKALEPFMSKNYRTEVKDLIKIIQRKSTGNGFEMEEIKVDFYLLHNGLKTLSKEELI